MVVTPDLSEHRLKDEDELDQAVGMGLYSPEQVGRIRAAAHDGLAYLRSNIDRFAGWAHEEVHDAPPLELTVEDITWVCDLVTRVRPPDAPTVGRSTAGPRV